MSPLDRGSLNESTSAEDNASRRALIQANGGTKLPECKASGCIQTVTKEEVGVREQDGGKAYAEGSSGPGPTVLTYVCGAGHWQRDYV